jgi:hypothetical protein
LFDRSGDRSSISGESRHTGPELAAAGRIRRPAPQRVAVPDEAALSTFHAAPRLDFADVHRQLQKNRHVTLQLLWEEHRETQPGGSRYSRFCELYRFIGRTEAEAAHELAMNPVHFGRADRR